MTSGKLSSVIGSNGTASPQQVVRQTPPIRFVVDLLWTCWRLSICCSTCRDVVDLLYNKLYNSLWICCTACCTTNPQQIEYKWSLSLTNCSVTRTTGLHY